jgi:hypothetical protein
MVERDAVSPKINKHLLGLMIDPKREKRSALPCIDSQLFG